MDQDKIAEEFVKKTNDLIRYGKFLEADDVCEQRIMLEPDFIPAYCERIRIALMTGDIDRAVQFINEGSQVSPDNPYIIAYQGYWLLSYGNYSKGLETLAHVEPLLPKQAELKINMAVALRFLNQLDAAEKKAKEGLELDPKSDIGHFELSKIYAAQGKKHESMAELEKTIICDPYFLQAYEALARFWMGDKNFEKAIKILRLAERYAPNAAPVLEGLAELYELQNDMDNAITVRERLTKIRKSTSDFNKLGIFYSLQKNFRRAKECFETLLEMTNNSWSSHNNLAEMYMESGEYDEAEKHFQLALKENPDATMLHYNLAWLYFKKKDYSRGIEWANKALDGALSEFWIKQTTDLIEKFPKEYQSVAHKA